MNPLCCCKQVALGDARMLEETSLKASHHVNTRVGPRGSDEDRGEIQTCVDTNHQSGLYLQSSETCYPTRSFQLHDDLNEFSNEWSTIEDVSQDVSFSLEGCVKWVGIHVYWKPVCITDLYRLSYLIVFLLVHQAGEEVDAVVWIKERTLLLGRLASISWENSSVPELQPCAVCYSKRGVAKVWGNETLGLISVMFDA